ncbi:glycosyl transferase group 1 family protein [Paramagnetospirillum magnetotacticum MS-1]|uniref:Glycosyl transferase group 1 family protein n=1 Tax=Paramagnetospirillum magnetotacticum MS-1 TaxID=272627 RepID=A0A0C2YRR8_PARME|nr:glycosyltransferase family 1 protein [Paramagnetospirillum magnetotacticum]KIL97828.1 glycosyl transferase group 1 family protein [Paramagnetospirillum magnetotacticum MS-1]
MGDGIRSNGKIRVIINALHAKSGGGVTYLRNILAPLVKAEDLEFHLFLHVDQYELFGEPPEGIRLHLLDFRATFLRLLAWEQIALPVLAHEMGADVTFSPANYGPLLAPNPVIVLRNSLAVVQRERRMAKRLYWVGLALATMVSLLGCRRAVAVSDYARKALGFGLPGWFGRKIEVIHHGVDVRFTPDPSVRRVPGKLLAVSDVYVQKNLHTLIAALPAIRAVYPEVRLVVAGRLVDAEYHGELMEVIRRHGLEDAVEFLGGVSPSRLVELYRCCSLFVFPSTVETFGNPLVEAMACGAPVLCSNIAAMPEVAGDGVQYFAPLDVDAMAQRVITLLGDEAARDDLGRRGLARAGNFSWDITAKRTADLLREAAR